MSSEDADDRDESSGQTTSISDVRAQTKEMVEEAMSVQDSTLIDAPPASGKTTATFKVASESDVPLTYLTARTDLYDQALEKCRENGLEPTVIPSPYRDCPSFGGDHGESVKEEVTRLYVLGVGGLELHRVLNLPCDPDCEYRQRWDDFDSDSSDPLIGHYKHAYLDSVVSGRVVAIDEYPGGAFEIVFNSSFKTITRFMKKHPCFPFNSALDLLTNPDDEGRIVEAYAWFQQRDAGPNSDQIFKLAETEQYHSLAPYLAFSMLVMVDLDLSLDNGLSAIGFKDWERVGLEHSRRCVFDQDDQVMSVLTPPDLSEATNVVALDGTPTKSLWDLVTGEDFTIESLLQNDHQKREYLNETLGLELKQAGRGLKAYSGGNVTLGRDSSLLFGIEVKEGEKPALISTKKAIAKYETEGLLQWVKDSRNFGEVLSSNDFSDEPLGVIMGAPYPGHHIVKRWAAYMGESVEVKGKGMKTDFGPVGNPIFEHFVHDQVLQAILRFGRSDGIEPTVYVNTRALPNWVQPDGKVEPTIFNSPVKRAVAQVLRDAGSNGATITSLAEATDASVRSVRTALSGFDEVGYISRVDNPGPNPSEIYWCGTQ